MVPCFCQLLLHSGDFLLELVRVIILWDLVESELALLDLVPLVDLSQQGDIHLGCGKLPLKMLDSVAQGKSRLLFQNLTGSHPVDLVTLQETETESLPRNFLLFLL